MDKPQAAICVFVGAILLYMSFFGLGGFGFQLALSTGFSDNFDDGAIGSQWVTAPGARAPTETGGKLVCVGVTGQTWQGLITASSYAMSAGSVSVDYQVTAGYPTVVLSLNNVGDPQQKITVRMQKDGRGCMAIIAENIAGSYRFFSGYPKYFDNRAGANFKLSIASGTIKFHIEGNVVATDSVPSGYDTSSLWAAIWCSSDGGTVAFDNFFLDTGAPTTGTTGTLKVYASYEGKYVATTVNIKGPQTTSGSTLLDGAALTLQLPPGSYEVSGTYNNVPKTEFATVTVNQTSQVTLNFGGATPPPPVSDAWEMIRALVESQAAKTIQLLAGIGLVGIGVIVLITPRRREYSPPVHRPYPPSY